MALYWHYVTDNEVDDAIYDADSNACTIVDGAGECQCDGCLGGCSFSVR